MRAIDEDDLCLLSAAALVNDNDNRTDTRIDHGGVGDHAREGVG